MPEELRVYYRQQLGEIEAKVHQLFALVADGLAAATDALLSGDREVVKELSGSEELMDAVHRQVELLVNQELALQAPVASDLRFLLSVLRVVPELERSHDLVEHIARRGAQGIHQELTPRARGLVTQMGSLGAQMWRAATDAWVDRDAGEAARLAERDDEMDELHASLSAELASGRMSLPVAMDMTLVARFYERLGDHAVNVTRRVVYLAGGQG
ncbi:MAG: phosphate signaling complex protein PhoU [Acidimicrobiales bacterium]